MKTLCFLWESLWRNYSDSHTNFIHVRGMCCKWRINLLYVNTLKPRQNGCHFPDDIFKCILLNEHVWITIKISLTFLPKGPINNIPAFVQIMAWCRRLGDKSLFESMLVNLLTHICVTWPQWETVWRYIPFSIVFPYYDGTGSCKPSSLLRRNNTCCKVESKAADDLAAQR